MFAVIRCKKCKRRVDRVRYIKYKKNKFQCPFCKTWQTLDGI